MVRELDENDDFGEIGYSGSTTGSNGEGDWEFTGTAQGYADPEAYNYDEIPSGGYQILTLESLFTNSPDFSDNCHGAEADGFEYYLSYENDDLDISWDNVNPSRKTSTASITIGLAPPLPGWASIGAGVSIPLGSADNTDVVDASHVHWDVSSNDIPSSQDDLNQVHVDLDHIGDVPERKEFQSWSKQRWDYWENCPEYHSYIFMSETEKVYNYFSLDVVDTP